MNIIKGKRITLIGGGGFIGHNLGLKLVDAGAEVSIIDSLQVNNLYSLNPTEGDQEQGKLYLSIINQRLDMLKDRSIKLHILDARDYHALSRLLDRIKPQVVIQLAAVSHANKSNKDPYSTFDHSLRTLENALDNCRKKVEHFIYFSSSMVYGHFNGEVISEDSVCSPLGIYGALKYAGEKLVIAYNQVFDTPYTIIRPSALYGERCISRRVGQIFLENAVRGKNVIINGDGSDSLDFTYIEDLVQGVIKSIENPNAINQIFNITYGKGRKISEMAELVKLNFPNIEIEYEKKDALTPDRGTLSIEKAKQLIDYQPNFNLEKGYQNYIDWYKNFTAS